MVLSLWSRAGVCRGCGWPRSRLVDEGYLRPQVGAVYPLAQAVEAYRAKAAGGIPGRIVIQP